MVNLVLPDSNIYIGAARAGVDPFQQFAPFLEDWEFATCGMIVLEVCRGVREPSVVERYRERFGVMIYVPTTNTIWERATHLAWSLDRRGKILPGQDLVIAACALHSGAAVLTHDAHYQSIPGLRVVNRLG
jgi:predicted nucleic acid-binding protein